MEYIKAKWKVLTSVATGIAAIITAGVMLGIEIPKPVFAGETKKLFLYISEVDNKITSEQLRDTKLRLYQNIREQQTYKNQANSVPNYLLNEQVELERRVDDLENHLDSLRKNN